jgi:DNA-binding NarL/FixJ family response regulator/GGDEF domain-containing protein
MSASIQEVAPVAPAAPRSSTAMTVLAASHDASTLETIERAIKGNGDVLFAVMDLAEAIATAASEKPEVAFVDVMLDGGAGLALVHHLTAVCPGIAVYAMAPESNLEMLSQAVALGAAGFVSAPPSGDALLHAVGAVREKRAEARAKAKLETDLQLAKRRGELMDRVVRVAHGGGQAEVARAIMEALAELSEARGAALYATFDPPKGECVRLVAMGTSEDLPQSSTADELSQLAKDRDALLVPVGVAERLLALAVLDKPAPERERDVLAMANLAATVLAFVDAGEARGAAIKDGRGRVYTFAYLQDIAGREIDKARRHGRRLSIAAIAVDPEAGPKARAEVEEIILSVVRDTDVLAKSDENEFFLLLPETGALGAHTCRRRLLVRAEGDRRARTASNDRRGPVASRPSRGVPISIGVAAYPHDGTSLERLLRAARQRAQEAERSAVHTLGLASLPLGEIIDTLLARPLFGAGIGSPYPLDLLTTATLSLVSAACREAKRGGAAQVLVTFQPGMGLVSSARQAFAYEPSDVTVHVADVRSAPRCEDAEAIVVAAEHGTWVCCGRVVNDRFRGVHAADPLLADLVSQRLAQASGIRFP